MFPPSSSKKIKKYLRITLSLLVFVGFLIFLRTFFFQVYSIQGNSMFPTLQHGDLVLVKKSGFPVPVPWKQADWAYAEPEIQKLDLILFQDKENNNLVKRAIGLPGEFYSIESGRVLIDSQMLEERYLPYGTNTEIPNTSVLLDFSNSPYLPMNPKGRIPPNYFLLLGDNREFSTDSRVLGLIPVEKLRGKVVFKF